MCDSIHCPIGYGDFDCEYYKENECQYKEDDING